MKSWLSNYFVALRLLAGLPITRDHFHASLLFILFAFAVSVSVFAGIDYLQQDPVIYQNLYGSALLGSFYFCGALLAIIICHNEKDYQQLPMLLTVMLSIGFWLALLVSLFPFAWALSHQSTLLPLLALAFAVYAMIRAVAVTFFYPAWTSHIIASLFIIIVATFSWQRMYFPDVFTSYEPIDTAQQEPTDIEYVFYQQQKLLDNKLDSVRQATQGIREFYFVGFGGSDRQSVFESEVKFADSVMQKHFGTQGRSVLLYNHADQLIEQPFANKYNLSRTLKQIGARMNTDEDILILLLSSHGSEAAELEVELHEFPLRQLDAADLREYLDDAQIKWRIIIISACYSGSFIEHLAEENTLVITASAKDKNSFGCSSDRELTVFGDAFLQQSLAQDGDIIGAFQNARKLVAQWEAEFELPYSDPQIFLGAEIQRFLDLTAPTDSVSTPQSESSTTLMLNKD